MAKRNGARVPASRNPRNPAGRWGTVAVVSAMGVLAGLLAGVSALKPARCPTCSAPTEDDFRFCGECGAAQT